ncbi:hypothetical protein EHQ61_08575 [Leptospira wolffii]|uniref:LIC12048 family lipoprotein n=1 Tax=Leptospira wolffii TaxID=409998 RepID=UPI001082A505|nr:LIC12048 family lipoprotein [Leptospira wolffii]TGL50824.1 hypothetical protein EHQ61_08575 [Leptospira wolffii]
MKTIFDAKFSFLIGSFALVSLFSCGDSGSDTLHNVNLSNAKWLFAEKVPLATNTDGGTVVPGATPQAPTPLHDLFSLTPGSWVSIQSLGGAIDPTGTTVENDFDGDGILNSKETTTNVWVADYPRIEATIMPPVTMKIEILQSTQTANDEIISEINSDDFESAKNDGSEKIHQNELNLKTVQYQEQFSNTTSFGLGNSSSANYGASYGGFGLDYGTSGSNNWNFSNSTSKTVTKWADKPFKNNIDSDAWRLKSDSSSLKARKYRGEKNTKINSTSKVDPNAGYIRAALYIKNLSTNMPVKLRNILCSLMFETGTGDLIPVQSFRLRNDDYSLFEIEVYGGSSFGPYVVELSGLNTKEIEAAIASGYNPKVFVVDYEMTHVADSNYRSNLLNYSGDNLKIVEENAKGRTGLIRIFGNNIRELFRVAAFDAVGDLNDPCRPGTLTNISPGISLRKALDRISCSGLEITYGDFVLDLSEIAPSLKEPRVHVKGIKSIGPLQNTIPCIDETHTGSDGVSYTACVQIPVSKWTDEQIANAGVWVIYSKGKYYHLTEYWKDGNNVRTFDPENAPKAVPMVKGVDSLLWAGDYIDIVYISAKDYLAQQIDYSKNPLTTTKQFSLNTAWDSSSLGIHPYYPDTASVYLGEAGFGEKIEIKIQLDKTQYLNPNFGTPESAGVFTYLWNFQYNRKATLDKYSIDQVSDFEVSLGFGGTRTDWQHIVKDLNPASEYKMKSCGRTLDFSTQVFTHCIQLPTKSNYVSEDISLIKLYLRPSLNSAYRKTIWPLRYTEVRKVRGELGADLAIGNDLLNLAKSYGNLEEGDTLYINGNENAPYIVQTISAPLSDGSFNVTLQYPVTEKYSKTNSVYVKGTLAAPDVRLSTDTNFVSEWNAQLGSTLPTNYDNPAYLQFLTGSLSCTTYAFHPVSCLGFSPDLNALNWMGGYNYGVAAWNSWADAANFDGFLGSGLFQITANTNHSYRLEPGTTDFKIGEHSGANPLSEPVVISNGDLAMVVWKKDTDVFGRFYQISTGTNLSGILDLTTASATGKFAVKTNGSKVVLLWDSGNDLYISVRNWDAAATTAVESKVATRQTAGGVGYTFDLAVGTTKALIAWNSVYTTLFYSFPSTHTVYNHESYARQYDLSTGAASAVAFKYYTEAIDSYNSGTGAMRVAADGSGTNAILANVTYDSNSYGIRAVPYDFNTGAIVGSLKIIKAQGANPGTSLSVGVTGTNAILVWRRPDNALFARSMDLSTGNLISSGEVAIDTKATSFKLSVADDIGLILYSTTTNRINLRPFLVSVGQLKVMNVLSLDTSLKATARKPGVPSLVGNNIISLWEHEENSKRTIRGRIATLSPFQLKGSGEFFVSTTNQGTQTGPSAVGIANMGLGAWLSQDTDLPRIRGYYLDLNNPGALQYGLNNFFVAPLIERDYTLWTKIIY